jgi:hypothetical protein
VTLEVPLIDRPENNWNIVASTVTPESIIGPRQGGVSISTIGRCFYEQCTMINSIDLSHSFAATHWMKSQPPPPSLLLLLLLADEAKGDDNDNGDVASSGGCMFPTCPVNNQNP